MVRAWEEVGPQIWYFFDKSTPMAMIRVCLALWGQGEGGRGQKGPEHSVGFLSLVEG